MGGLAILLLILALVVGGVGLLVEGLMWLLIIAVVLAVVGAITGRVDADVDASRHSKRHTHDDVAADPAATRRVGTGRRARRSAQSSEPALTASTGQSACSRMSCALRAEDQLADRRAPPDADDDHVGVLVPGDLQQVVVGGVATDELAQACSERLRCVSCCSRRSNSSR